MTRIKTIKATARDTLFEVNRLSAHEQTRRLALVKSALTRRMNDDGRRGYFFPQPVENGRSSTPWRATGFTRYDGERITSPAMDFAKGMSAERRAYEANPCCATYTAYFYALNNLKP
jgi:hypothetical protein